MSLHSYNILFQDTHILNKGLAQPGSLRILRTEVPSLAMAFVTTALKVKMLV